MRVVAALGGNALLERSERPDAGTQRRHVATAVKALAPIVEEHDVVVTHGNGPQVGLLAVESEADPLLRRPYPFDVLVAQTQGMIGYWVLQALENTIGRRRVAALVTQVVVDEDDPAFGAPTKFVGPLYSEEQAKRAATRGGWEVARDGTGWRRVVPSPEPVDVVELDEIEALLRGGSLVVCAGGGGIPVVRDAEGYRGVEAVVDKDLSAALVARRIGAAALLILTDVEAVELDFGTPRARAVPRATPSELRAHSFPPGSMGPKIEAACRFVEATGGFAAIGRLDDAELLLAGKAGTLVEPG